MIVSTEPIAGEPQKHRRNSKFTFEELQQADLQLGLQEKEREKEKDSPTKTISPVKAASNSNNSSHRRQGNNAANTSNGAGKQQTLSSTKGRAEAKKMESLPQLPSLSHMTSADSLVRNSLYAYSSSADPTVVQNVYKSLNILNGHIALMTPSLSASITAAPGNATPLSGPASVSRANHSGLPNSRVASIDQELDALLTGSSGMAVVTAG